MPTINLTLRNGSDVPFRLPDPGQGKSCFFVGVQKGGSTMLAGVARAIGGHAGLSFYSVQTELRSMGFSFPDLTPDVRRLFVENGYCYGGFRGIIDPIELPAFASGRTIFLVRDPRDMVTSQYFSEAISHKPPGSTLSDDRKKAFEARRERVRAMPIDEFVEKRATHIVQGYDTTLAKLARIDHKIFRYEDIIFDKTEWVGGIADYLRIEIAADAIETIARQADVIPTQEDATKHIRKVTPGDHTEKLRPETIARLNKTFEHILTTFGYN